MATRRTSHAVYDAKYHLVWTPKYRKWVLRGNVQDRRVEELFEEIGERHEIEIDAMEVASDHVHLFVSFPPRLLDQRRSSASPEAISAKVVFEEFPGGKASCGAGSFGRWLLRKNSRRRSNSADHPALRRIPRRARNEARSVRSIFLMPRPGERDPVFADVSPARLLCRAPQSAPHLLAYPA